MSEPPLKPSPSVSTGDAYTELLNRTRDLDLAHRRQRDHWFERLAVDNREELLFELEVLLKATACFANPRNHPGQPRRTSLVAQDYREATTLLRDGLIRAVQLTRLLLGSDDRSYVFHRYLETVMPEDGLGVGRPSPARTPGSPHDALVALRYALTNGIQVTEGLLRAPRVPFRMFYSVSALVKGEVAHNAFFNPLSALEFRPEFDRIEAPQLLQVIRGGRAGASPLVALTFLSLLRMLRYLRLLRRIVTETTHRDLLAGRAYLVLSVLRSDARALSEYLRRRAGVHLARGYERSLFSVSARDLEGNLARLRSEAEQLLSLRATFDGISGCLRLEMRRSFLHDLPAPDTLPTAQALRESLESTIENLRPALRHLVLFTGAAVGGSFDEVSLFEDEAARRESLERQRRDVWMFSQILRAFAAKVAHTELTDAWSNPESGRHVRAFLSYFRAMGFSLLRFAHYPEADAFVRTMRRLASEDLVEPGALGEIIAQCGAFRAHLEATFEQLSAQDALRGRPFDRREAAASLRHYLRDAA